MATAFQNPIPEAPIGSKDDAAWLGALRSLDEAVSNFLHMKQQLLTEDPVREHVLHFRHEEQLRRVKRKFDAVAW